MVTRADLSAGYQATMATHAGIDFGIVYGDTILDWHEASNSLVVLTVPNEEELFQLMNHVKTVHPGIPLIGFTEPDINDELTAIALMPRYVADCPTSWLKELPLCLKDKHDPRWIRETELRRASHGEEVSN